MKIVVIGGGASGIGAAGAALGVDPSAEMVVYTEFEDVAYSPCGIPFVHGNCARQGNLFFRDVISRH